MYQLQAGLARIQENGRIVNSLLGLPIQQAGNIGCNAFREDLMFCPQDGIDVKNYGLVLTERLLGLNRDELINNNLVPKMVADRVILNSDIIWIKSVSKRYKIFQKKEYGPTLYVRGNISLKPHQIFFISTCTQLQAFKAKDRVEANGTSSLTKIHLDTSRKFHIKKIASPSLELSIFSSKIFYVGKTSRLNSNGDEIDALYSTDLNGRTIELVEGVERMKIRYGIKNPNHIIYLSADEINSWNDVVSVQVSLLLNSIEPAYQTSEKYILEDEQILSKDRLMRKWWVYEWPIRTIG